MPGANDQRATQLKQLLVKFRKQHTTVAQGSDDLDDFTKLLDLNGQLAQPKNLCIEDWALLNEIQSNEHRQVHGHTVVSGETLTTLDQFVAVAQRYDKCQVGPDGQVISLVTPISAPPPSIQITQQNMVGVSQAEPSAMSQHTVGPQMTAQNPPTNGDMPTIQSMHPPIDFSNSNIGPTMTMNTIQPNHGDPYGEQTQDQGGNAGDPLHDPTLGNTGIEIIRLNKKFDIFMKRFMRAEEDIKEVKQNFYRVMHCAFAKYEQGFKRKNEYLERRRIKRKEEIERGVAQELKKRGMTGELDDPLLHHGVGDGDSTIMQSASAMGRGADFDDDDAGKSQLPIDDSELSNGIVGIDMNKKPRVSKAADTGRASQKKSQGKDKKKQKKHKSGKKSRPTSRGNNSDVEEVDVDSLRIMT